jgi:hypothetical protein
MLDEPDIWRAADLLLKNCGDAAPLVAAQRADELLAAGDVKGRAVWLGILRVVGTLLATTPSGRVH